MNKTPANLPLPNDETPTPQNSSSNDAVLNLLRQKVDKVYAAEPDFKEESKEVQAVGAHSKHQKFIKQLMESGKDMVAIQTEWHQYYDSLSADEKHEVWQEFYANHSRKPAQPKVVHHKTPHHTQHQPHRPLEKTIVTIAEPTEVPNEVTQKQIKQKILKKVNANGKLSKKHHFQSLIFGASMGLLVILVFMFGFFNERFIAPFISPSKVASNEQIILDPNASNSVGPLNKVIIPKINADVPVVYDVDSTKEAEIQKGLERGVVHYPTTPTPGQKGNAVIVGHSSSNIFTAGQFKFAFVLLNKLDEGDTIIAHYNGTRYVYKIYDMRIVKPTEVGVLGPADRESTITLITCDPPGSNVNRLVVTAEQISPSPKKNVAAKPKANASETEPAIVPGNSQSLFSRIFGGLFN
jgi:sortase A